ncbi:MAG: ATP-binding cassette domain-containing protein [Vescimonas sp.]
MNLGRLILEDTDILLLDEPTNHLDLKATEWLEDYICTSSRAPCWRSPTTAGSWTGPSTRVIEIQDGKAEFYAGNYSFYAVEKERRYQEQLKQYQKEQAKIQQLEEGRRAAADLGLLRATTRLQAGPVHGEAHRAACGPPTGPPGSGRWRPASARREFQGDDVLHHRRGVSKSFGQRSPVLRGGPAGGGGERIALLGDNGAGKSTLLKIITGGGASDSGKIRMGPTVKIGYLPQIIHFDHPERSLLDTMLYELRLQRPRLPATVWPAFQFRGRTCSSRVSALSGGEQSAVCGCACSWTRRSTS